MNRKLSLSTRGLRMIGLGLALIYGISDELVEIARHFKRRLFR